MLERTKKYIVGLVVLLVGFFAFRICDRHRNTVTSATTLSPGIVEKIIVNPDTHKVIIVKPEGSQELFLPDRPSSIEIDKQGHTIVTSRQMGTELKVFFGALQTSVFRLAVGVDGLYYKKLDVGFGLASQVGNHTPVVFAKASYNVWSNCQIGLTIDNQQKVGVLVAVRL